MSFSFSRMARDVLEIEETLYQILPYKTRMDMLEVKAFPQIWSNTSGGFESIGGSAMTTQMTYVVVDNLTNIYYVFFGQRFAYKVIPNETFSKDLIDCNLKGKSNYKEYYQTEGLSEGAGKFKKKV